MALTVQGRRKAMLFLKSLTSLRISQWSHPCASWSDLVNDLMLGALAE